MADKHRPAAYLEGLTQFLRDEYYRKLGVYINRSDDESIKLIKFWKDNVSEVYRKRREEILAAGQSGSGMMSPDEGTRRQRGGKEPEGLHQGQAGFGAEHCPFHTPLQAASDALDCIVQQFADLGLG